MLFGHLPRRTKPLNILHKQTPVKNRGSSTKFLLSFTRGKKLVPNVSSSTKISQQIDAHQGLIKNHFRRKRAIRQGKGSSQKSCRQSAAEEKLKNYVDENYAEEKVSGNLKMHSEKAANRKKDKFLMGQRCTRWIRRKIRLLTLRRRFEGGSTTVTIKQNAI